MIIRNGMNAAVLILILRWRLTITVGGVLLVAVTFVRLYDHLHELVSDDIFVRKIYKLDALEIFQNNFGFLDAAFLAARQVDLGPVARDNCF